MNALLRLHDAVFARIERLGDPLLPLLARFVFAATLLRYFWNSALTKLGDGPFSPAMGAYAQIFPRQLEAVGYDIDRLTLWHRAVVLAGTWAEFLLPALIVAGLATRPAAAGMIVFVAVQSLTDIYGHGIADAATLGAWFDGAPDAAILDQRLFWVFVLAVLVIRGGGPLSADALLRRTGPPRRSR